MHPLRNFHFFLGHEKENKAFFVQYLTNQPVKIQTHIDTQRSRREFPLTDVGDLVAAYFPNNPPNELAPYSLHSISNGLETNYYSWDPLTVLVENGRPGTNPLIIKSRNDTVQGIVHGLTVADTLHSMLPFKPVYDSFARINVQYQRFGYCRYLAGVFGVQLKFDNLPRREYDVNSYFFRQIMKTLLERGIKRLVFDESQRQLGLIEFITKETLGRPFFIITGTPPHGKNAIDYGGSVSARVAMVNLSDLRPPEVKQLIQAIFKTAGSSCCVLNFWTRSVSLPAFRKGIFIQMDDITKSRIALGEIFPQEWLRKCIDEARTALQEGGIGAVLFNAIPTTGVNRKDIEQGLQKDGSQLLNRGKFIISQALRNFGYVGLTTMKDLTLLKNFKILFVAL